MGRTSVRAGLTTPGGTAKKLGRPITAATKAGEGRALRRAGISKAEIARRLQIGRTSVRRILG
jgi:DNA invertase Pin-like site-specific DNA recombinase